MRIDRTNIDAFAALYKAGPHRKRKAAKRGAGHMPPSSPSTVAAVDLPAEKVSTSTPRQYKTRREREIEAIAYEQRRTKSYLLNRKYRLDRVTQGFPGAKTFLRSLAKAEPKVRAIAYRDVDADLAALAQACGVADIENNTDRFAVFEEAVDMVVRVSKRDGFKEHDPETYFTIGPPTALDELKQEMRLR